MIHYDQYNPEDFAADDYFKEWVCAPTPESDRFWKAFLADYPERYYQVEEARQLVIGLDAIQADATLASRQDAIWHRIERTVQQRKPTRRWTWPDWQQSWNVAASVLVVLATTWLGLFVLGIVAFPGLNGLTAEDQWIEIVNDASHLMHVQLADGSRVELQKDGRVRYRQELAGKQREVFLTGEAFFAVRRNPQKPFVVHANGLVTKVLGTRFRIKAPPKGSTVMVDVQTGRVSVYPDQPGLTEDPEANGLVLNPNQKAIFQCDDATLRKTLTESPGLLNPAARFVFEDASASHVFRTIEQAYGVNVIFDEELMHHCTLTLSLDQEDFFQKLDVICKVLNARYKLIDAQVVIDSKGCPTAR